jgi:hypothetical protein
MLVKTPAAGSFAVKIDRDELLAALALAGKAVATRIEWLKELVESLDGEPLLIAYEFIEDLRTFDGRARILEARFARANGATPEDLQLYCGASGTLSRLLQALGLKRRARDVTLDLSRYLTQQTTPASPVAADGALPDLDDGDPSDLDASLST